MHLFCFAHGGTSMNPYNRSSTLIPFSSALMLFSWRLNLSVPQQASDNIGSKGAVLFGCINKNISRSRCNSSILTNLPQVSMHGLASRFGIMVPNGVEEAFMRELSALRAALNRKDLLALLSEQVDNGVNEGEHQDVLCALGQGAVKLVVGGNVGIGILQTGIHRLHRFLHGRHVFLGGAPRSESGNLRLQHFAHLRQIS